MAIDKEVCLTVLAQFGLQITDAELSIDSIRYPTPHSTAIYCTVHNRSFVIVQDDTVDDEHMEYLYNQIDTLNPAMQGTFMKNIVREDDGAVYPVGVSGKQYVLWRKNG